MNVTGQYCGIYNKDNGGGGSIVTISGSGVALGIGFLNNVGSFGDIYKYTFTANTDVTITVGKTAGGGGGDVITGMVRTNCNADDYFYRNWSRK